MNYIIEANRFLNDEKLGLYFSNEKKGAVVKFAVWLFKNAAQQSVHPTGGTPCEVCGFAPGWHDLEKHFPVLPASG
jgi:hypothetical protein